MQKHVSNKNKIIVIFIAIFTVVCIALLVLIFKPMIIEDYCQKQANKTIGGADKWSSQMLPANSDEKSYLGGNGQITIGFREQLKCEKKFCISCWFKHQ
jgi:hypothetical protein